MKEPNLKDYAKVISAFWLGNIERSQLAQDYYLKQERDLNNRAEAGTVMLPAIWKNTGGFVLY